MSKSNLYFIPESINASGLGLTVARLAEMIDHTKLKDILALLFIYF